MGYSNGDRAKKVISDINMCIHEWKPGLAVGSEKFFNGEAEKDGEDWFERGLTEDTIKNWIANGEKNAEKIKSLSKDIRQYIKENNNTNDSFDKILLKEKLLDKDYQIAFIRGWNVGKRRLAAEKLSSHGKK